MKRVVASWIAIACACGVAAAACGDDEGGLTKPPDAAVRIDARVGNPDAAGPPIDAAVPPVDAAVPDGAPGLAGKGEVCGTSNADLDAGALPCEPGLVCCYPCGIPGCLDVCMIPCDPGPGCSKGCPLVP